MTNYPMIIHLGLSCEVRSHEPNTLQIWISDRILQTEQHSSMIDKSLIIFFNTWWVIKYLKYKCRRKVGVLLVEIKMAEFMFT